MTDCANNTPTAAHVSAKDPQRLPVLKKRREFLRVASGRNKWATGSLILQGLQRKSISGEAASETISGPRVGFTTSKKVGNAVARNRARRRLREAARVIVPKLGRADYDYVLIGRPETVDVDYGRMIRDLELAISRVNDPDRQQNKRRSHGGRAEKPARKNTPESRKDGPNGQTSAKHKE